MSFNEAKFGQQIDELFNDDSQVRLFAFNMRTLLSRGILDQLAANGQIDPSKIYKILDFGAGSGGPTKTMTEIFGDDRHIEAVEYSRYAGQKIIDDDILPSDKVHITEGIGFLKDKAETGEGYDLITAFWLGPDEGGGFSASFILAAQKALLPGGKIMITSDPHTMAAARTVAASLGTEFAGWQMTPHPEIELNTVVIEREPAARYRRYGRMAI